MIAVYEVLIAALVKSRCMRVFYRFLQSINYENGVLGIYIFASAAISQGCRLFPILTPDEL